MANSPEPTHNPDSAAPSAASVMGLLGFALLMLKAIDGLAGQVEMAMWRPTLELLAWVLPAHVIAARRGQDPLVEHGVAVWPRRWRAPLFFLCLVGLPLYLLGVHTLIRPIEQAPTFSGLVWSFSFQLLFVAVGEEYFFRGVLQPSLNARLGPHRGLILGALLFAAAHALFAFNPQRLEVFGPGLIFGWLRHRTGSILPGAFFHALCNAIQGFAPLR